MKALSFFTAISLLLSFLTPVVAVAAAPAPATVAASPAADVLPAWMSQPSERQSPVSSSAELLPAWMSAPASAGTAASNPAAILPAWFEAAPVSAPQTAPANAPLRVVTSPAGLSVSGPATVNVCDTLTYTVVFTNNTTPITDVIVTSTMYTPYVPSPQSCGPYAMAANEVRTCTFVFDGGCKAVSGQNVVTLTQYGAEPIVRYTDLVVNPGAIIVRKEPAVQPAHLDDVVTWTVSVENTGYGDVTNVVLTDVLGSGMVYQSGLTTMSIPRMSVGEVLTFPVSARVDGCFDLTNVVTGTWGCDGQTCLTSQMASAAIDLQMRNPDLVYTLPAGFDVPFCAGSQTFIVPITNQGDGAAYSTTLTTDLSSFAVTTAPGATYSGGAFHLSPIAPGATYNLVFTLTLPADVCTMSNGGNFNFDIVYYDRCGNPYYELPQRAGWQLIDVPGEIDLSKTMPAEVYRGETVTATITVDVSGISSDVIITDTVPAGWTVLDAGGGTTFVVGNTTYITWSVGASDTFNVVLLTPSDTLTGCAACGTRMTNVVAAWGTDCQDCARTANTSASTYIQCDDGITSDKQVSAPLVPCSDDTFTYTNTYVFGNSFSVTPTWGDLVFTETLEYQTYVTGTAAVWVSNGSLSCAAAFSESTAGGPLVITNISPTCAIDLPGATLQINYQTRVGEPAACSDARWYDWSYLNLGVTGNDACAYDGVLQEGVFVETRAPQMQLTMSDLPATVSSCGAYTVTLTADRTTPDIAAYDAVIDLVTDTFAVLTVLGFDGALPILTETNASGYHWYYGDAFTTALTATVQLHVQLRCADTAPFSATLHYDNRCADNDFYREPCPAGGTLGNPLVAPCAPILTKFPEVIYATSDFVRWTLTVFNSGAGPAHNVTLTDTLGSGLRYVDSTITSTEGSVAGVTPVTSSRYVTWTLPVIQPKERVTILYDAEVIGCNDLTNSFGGQQGCLGEACLQGCADTAYVELPPTLLLNTNQFVSPIDTCYTRTITVTVRNAGMLSVYSATVRETLPADLNYVPGTTEVSTDTVNWQPGPDPYISGYQLRWDPTSGPPLDVWLARIRPYETVYIRFQTTASCLFASGQIRVQTSYLDPCGRSYDTLASSYVMQSRQPDLVFEKTGQNLDRAHPDPSLVYAEPGERVLWTITATNLTGASPATNVVVSDTLPGNAVYQGATPGYNLSAPPGGTLGGWITWTLGTLNPGQTVVLTVSTVISDPEGCLPLDTRNAAQLLWGCDDGCRVIMEAQAELRTRPLFDTPELLTSIAPNTLNRCGGVLTVTLVNNGPPAYNVVLTDTLPTGFVYSDTVSASTSPSGTIDLGQSVVYTWAVLPTGMTTIAFSVRNANSSGNACALPAGPNSIVLQYDDDAEDCFNTGPYTTTAPQDLTFVGPTLSIAKTPPDQTLDVYDPVAWTLTVQNSGNGVAYNVVVTDVVGTNYVNVDAGVGSDGTAPLVAGNAITWTLVGPLAVGAWWTATVTADIIATGDNTNRAWVLGGCDTGCVTSSAYDEAHTTLLEEFGKQPGIQTGTIGSLVAFTITARLSDWDALYENVILTDTLPVGLGYLSSVLTYTYDQDQGGGTAVVSSTPTLAPAGGPVVWQLGDLPGIVQINGVITAVIQNIAANQDGVQLTNRFDMTYIDDGVLYAQTDTAAVDILEPLLHIGKTYVTPDGCAAALLEDNFNSGGLIPPWLNPSNGSGWGITNGMARNNSNAWNRRIYRGDVAWTDYSYSAMMMSTDTTGDMGLVFRAQGLANDQNYYRFRWNRNNNAGFYRLERVVNGSATLLGASVNTRYETGTWYHIEIQAIGNRFLVYIDGALVLDRTDNQFPTGRIGLYANNQNVAYFDDVLVTRLDDMACYVGADDLVTYTLTISNQTQLPAYDLVITDVIPAGTSLWSYDIINNSAGTLTTTQPAPIPGATGALVWGFNYLTPTVPFNPLNHTYINLHVVLRVSEQITANIVLANQAFLTYDAWEGDSEPVPEETRNYSGGSHSTAIRTVNGDIVKTVQFAPPPTATLGTLVTYTLIVPATPISATLYDVVVTDTLDSRLYIEDVTFSGGTGGAADWAGQLVTGTFASIPHSTQAYITVTARISDGLGADAGEVIMNIAEMSHATAPITTSNEVHTEVGEPLLVLVKASDPPTSSTVGAGDSITYAVTITNIGEPAGPSPAYDIVFTDTLPVGMRAVNPVLTVSLNNVPVSSSEYVTGYTSTTGVFTVTFTPAFSIPVGGVLELQYIASVDNDVQANIDLTNLAEVSWSSLPGDTPGDRDYDPITGATTVHTAIPAISKGVLPPTVTIGSQVVYTITVPEPPIPAMLYNVIVTDVVDSRLRVDAVSSNATFSGQIVTAALGTIPTNTQQIIVITATVRDLPTVTNGTQIPNVAVFDYDGNPGDPVPTEPVTVTVVEPRITLKKRVETPRDPLGAGDLVTYSIVLTNTGDWPAYDLVVTDSLPLGLAYVNEVDFTVTDPATATTDGMYPIWTLSQLNPGGQATIRFTAQVDAGITAGVTLTNAAWGEYSGQPGDNPDEREYDIPTDTVSVDVGNPALDLVKSAVPDPVEAGGLLTYTLTVTNTGIVSATGVVLTDAVPLNTTYLDCGPLPCGEVAGVVSWTLGTLDVNATRVLTMLVQVASPLLDGTLLTNTAWVTSTEGITDTDTIDTPVDSAHTLAITKTSDPAVVQAGDLLTYTLAWSVSGNEPALGVTISDTIPANTTYRASDPAATTSPPVGGTGLVTWDLGDQNPPASGVVTLVVQVDTPLLTGTVLSNAALITDTQGITDTDTVDTPVESGHTLALTKTAEPPVVQAGNLLTYTLAWAVSGNEPALGVTISDTLPAHTSFVTATLPHALNGDLVLWNLGDQTPGASGVVTLVVLVDTPLLAGTMLSNAALITDTQGITDTGTVDTPVESAHTLAITKTSDPAVVQAGDLLTYTLAWSVSGNEPALGVTISDTIPANTTYRASDPAATTSPPVGGTGLVTWDLGDQNPPASGVVTLVARVDTPLLTGTVLFNAVLITDTQGLTDTDTIDTPVGSAHTLALTKTADPAVVQAGDLLTYTLAWAVAGNQPALGVTISDTVPANTAFDSCSGGLTCGESGGLVTWGLGDQNPPTSGVVTLVVRVDSNVPTGTLLYNAASITDTQGLTDTGEITTPVETSAEIWVMKTGSVSPVTPGEPMTYSLTITNDGPSDAENVVVTDTLPAEVTFDSASPAPTSGPNPLVWTLGTLTPGESRSIFITVTVNADVTAGFTNTVIITTTTPGDDPGNNEDDHPVDVTPLADVAIVKSGSHSPAVAGGPLVYTLVYTNYGPSDAQNVVVTDTLPAEVTFDSASPAPTSEPNPLLWNLGTLAAGDSGQIVITVTVNADVTGTFTNTVVIATDTPESDYDNNDDDEPTDVVSADEVAILKAVTPFTATIGNIITYTLLFPEPPLGAPLDNVTVMDRFAPWLEIQTIEAPGSAAAVWELYAPNAAITVTYASIPTGEQRLITVTAGVISDEWEPPWSPVAGDVMTNVATLAYGAVVTTSNEVTTTVVEPELVIVKASDPPQSSTVAPGQAVTYTVTITNVGDSPAYRYDFEDQLPVGMQQITPTLLSVTIDGATVDPSGYYAWIVPGTVFIAFENWTPLPAGSVLQIVYVAYVDDDVAAGVDLTNTVSIDWMSAPPDMMPGPRVYPPISDTNTVHVGHPALDLAKSAIPNPVEPGGLLTYTLTVSNTGVFALAGVVITDVIPIHTTFVAATLPHDGPAPDDTPGSVITWTVGALDAGATRVLTLVVAVDSLLLDGTLITNTAWVTSTEGLTDTDTIITLVESWHSLAITKTADPSPVQAGDLLTYALTWSVAGNEPALGVTISDTVPANTAFDSCSGGLTCGESGGLVTWELGDQNPPASGVVTLVVRVDSNVPTGTLLYNAASITDTQGLTDTGEITTPVETNVEIWVVKTGSASPVTPGEPMTYSLTITNDGPSDAENVVVTDTLPAEVTFESASPAPTSGPNPLVWTLGMLTPGESRSILITVTVNSNVTAGFTNTAIITTATPGDDPGNNEDDHPVDVTPAVEIWVTKTGSASPVIPGEPMTYSLTITNDGPSDAENVVVTDTLPVEVTFDSASPAPTSGPNPLVWNLGTLPADESRSILITVTLNANVTAGFTNTVIITTITPGDDPGNNEDDHPVDIVASADLAITKSDSPDPVVSGDALVYTLVYTNYGPSDAANVVVVDTLPAEVTFVTASPLRTSGPNPLTWNLGTVAAGDSGRIVITTTVNSDVTAPFTNTVVITGDTSDDNPGNNTDEESTLPLTPGMELVKTVLPGAAVPNMPFTYVIAITNTGYVTLDPLILTDTLPSLDFHYVAGSAMPSEPAVIAPPLLVWPDLGPLDPGASISVTFAVTVTPGLTLGTYVNVALTTGDHPGGVLTDTDDVPIVIEDPAIALSKHLIGFDTDIWVPNFVTFTIVVTNVGISEIDVLPLYDLYDPFYLHFADAFPVMPDTVDNVNGQVVWFDLTTPAPHGFGRNLLLGEVFSITTVFTVVNEITLPVTNTAVVSDATDIYDNPTPDEEDEEVIIDIPTAVDLLYFRAVALSEGIRLEWATAVEIDNFGFTLHRATEPDFTRASEIVFIPSACRGNLCGATYDYLDTAVDPDAVYWYWLVDVDTSGVTTRHGPVSGRVYGATLPIRVFLPLVLRNR